jgi:hypothetical protein
MEFGVENGLNARTKDDAGFSPCAALRRVAVSGPLSGFISGE